MIKGLRQGGGVDKMYITMANAGDKGLILDISDENRFSNVAIKLPMT